MEVSGINKAEGIPRKFTISSNEILEALTEPLNNVVSGSQIGTGKDAAPGGCGHCRQGHDADRWRRLAARS